MELLAKVKIDVPPPLFCTRMFPDQVPGPELGPKLDESFFEKLLRRFPNAGVVWNRELKDRKSGDNKGQWVPHFHDLIWGLPKFGAIEFTEERGEWVKVFQGPDECWRVEIWALDHLNQKYLAMQSRYSPGSGDMFRDWLARAWYEIVGSGDIRHYRAGTSAECLRESRAGRCYVSKAARYVSKEEDEACSMSPYFVGCRSWGVRGKKNIPFGQRRVITLTHAVLVRLMRAGANYIKSVSSKRRRFCSFNVFIQNSDQWIRLVLYYQSLEAEPF
jgi:hypothetical protein